MISKIYIGGGCFWCTEAYFKSINVIGVVPGYAGGHVIDPTYKQVCSGMTGHAELIEVTYDDEILSFEELLHVFFLSHDPTTLNRQGNDVGTQYRSVIFHRDQLEKKRIEKFMEEESHKYWDDPIVTTIEPLTTFYPAEDYHHDYYAKNPKQGYCQVVITPKLIKLKQELAKT